MNQNALTLVVAAGVLVLAALGKIEGTAVLTFLAGVGLKPNLPAKPAE